MKNKSTQQDKDNLVQEVWYHIRVVLRDREDRPDLYPALLVEEDIKYWLGDIFDKAKKETEKAFGGCLKCYGKGYSTNFYGTSNSPDFEGDRYYESKKRVHVTPCSCERGKQISTFLKKEIT